MASLTETRQRWRWLVLIATILGSLLAEPMILVSGIYLIPWADTFDCTIGQVSIIASVATFSYHLGSLSGIWMDRIGYRAVVVTGGALMSVGVLASAFVPSRIIMIFTFGFVSCFFAGTTFPAFNVALVSYFSKNFGTIRGISSAGTGLGIFAIPPLLQYLVSTYGWRGSLVVFSAIASHLVFLGMLLRPESAWKRLSSRKKQVNRENTSISMPPSKSDKSLDRLEEASISAKDSQHFCIDKDDNADVGIPFGYNVNVAVDMVEDDFGRAQKLEANKETTGRAPSSTADKCCHVRRYIASEDDAGLTVDGDVHNVNTSSTFDDKPGILSATITTEAPLVKESITEDDTGNANDIHGMPDEVDTVDSNGHSNSDAAGDSLVVSDLKTGMSTENKNFGKKSTMGDDIFNKTCKVKYNQSPISNGNNISYFPKTNTHIASDGEVNLVMEVKKPEDGETSAGSRNDDLLPCDFGEVVQVISLSMNSAKSPSGGEVAHGSLKGLWSILRHSYRIYLPILAAVFLGVAHDGVVNHLPTSLVYRGVEPQAASLLMSFVGIGSIVGRAASGLLVDHHLIRTSTLLGVAIFALGGTMILFRVVATYWLYAIASFFFGATSGITFNLLVVFARECVGKTHMGRAITLIMVGAGLGSIIGPVMAGWLYDKTQSYNLPFFIMGGILLLGGLMFAVEPKLRRMESEKAKGLLRRIQDSKTQNEL